MDEIRRKSLKYVVVGLSDLVVLYRSPDISCFMRAALKTVDAIKRLEERSCSRSSGGALAQSHLTDCLNDNIMDLKGALDSMQCILDLLNCHIKTYDDIQDNVNDAIRYLTNIIER